MYSKIPILRPPLGLSKSGLKDHFWAVPKVVSNQRYTGCRKQEKNYLNFPNKVFNGKDVLILGSRNSGISLYFSEIFFFFILICLFGSFQEYFYSNGVI